MSGQYFEWVIQDWNDAHCLANTMAENWIFRGHGNSNWPLVSSLERHPKVDGSVPFWIYDDAERAMLDGIRRQGHLVADVLPYGMDSLDWLALLQHHVGSHDQGADAEAMAASSITPCLESAKEVVQWFEETQGA